MIGTHLSSTFTDLDTDFSFLTKVKIDEISDRISKDALDLIFSQLEENIQAEKKAKNNNDLLKANI